MRPTTLTWQAHGSPVVEECSPVEGHCFVCSAPCVRGVLTDKWLKSSFTDQNRAVNPTSEVVCEACVYLHARTSPVLGRPAKPGKQFGGNFRNYSHLWSKEWGGDAFGESEPVAGYANASKGEKPLIRQFLGMEHKGPWFAAVAESGQKHVVPYAPMNGPGRGGYVRFEESTVVVPDSLLLVEQMTDMLTAGVTKDEVTSGEYTPRAWLLAESRIRAFEDAHSTERSSGWFALAIWLAQRDEEKVARRLEGEKDARRRGKGKAKDNNRGGSPGAEKRVPERVRQLSEPEALGAPTVTDAGGGQNDSHPGGMVHSNVPRSPDTTARQLGLFGDS